jgi:hypothetical protein
MTTELAPKESSASLLERVLVGGDLSKLTATERLTYYRDVCHSLKLNPLTRPFDYLYLNNRLLLYARKEATDQLRETRKVSVYKLEKERFDDLFVVTAYVRDKEAREDSSTGAVSIANLKGEALANAIMKAETKAKRRATLSLCGLGMLDETEVAAVPDAKPGVVNLETGEIIENGPETGTTKELELPLRPPDDPARAGYLARIEQGRKALHLTEAQLCDVAEKVCGLRNVQQAETSDLAKLLSVLIEQHHQAKK